MAEIEVKGKQIVELPSKQALDGTEAVMVQDAEGSKQTTVQAVKEYAQPDLSGYATKEEVSGIAETLYMYGVEFDTTVSSPDCTRIGNMELHRSLPVQSAMRGCLLDDTGSVVKYLDPSDWTGETRDGSSGQVMVEIPEHWMKFETEGTKRRVKLSAKPIEGYRRIARHYVSAYQAAMQRSTGKLCSVVNTDADYRGGDNTADYDGTAVTLLGVPVSALNRTLFREAARKRGAAGKSGCGWNCLTYNAYKDIFWLFATEYATLDSQKEYSEAKDSGGFMQGGLGDGVSDDMTMSKNGYNPFVECGYTDSLGNGTGYVRRNVPVEVLSSEQQPYAGEWSETEAYTKNSFVLHEGKAYMCIADAPAGTLLTDTAYWNGPVELPYSDVPRYRGIENPFGHIFQWADGVNVMVHPDEADGGSGLSEIYVCSDPALFSDTDNEGYEFVGYEYGNPRSQYVGGYVKEVVFGDGGEILPYSDEGSLTTYFCDYAGSYVGKTTDLRGVVFGGYAVVGSICGFACSRSDGVPSYSNSLDGSRLCFIPE